MRPIHAVAWVMVWTLVASLCLAAGEGDATPGAASVTSSLIAEVSVLILV